MEENAEDKKIKLINRGSELIEIIISIITEFNNTKVSRWHFWAKKGVIDLEKKYNSIYIEKYIPYNKDVTALAEQLINAREVHNSTTNQIDPIDLNTRALLFIYTSELGSQRDYCRTLFQEFRSRIDNYNSGIQNSVSLMIGFLALIVASGSLCFAAIQAQDTKDQIATLSSIARTQNETQESTKKAVSEELTITLDTRLSDAQNTAIIQTISEKKNPFEIFTEYQIDNYLAIYEILDVSYNKGLISNEDFCNMFSDGILTAYEDKNIQNYIKSNQEINSKYYSGFKDLSNLTYEICK
jgi:hypothetical protein